MIHTPVFNGDGHYCSRCNVSWDQGDPEPADCLPSEAGLGTQTLRIPDVSTPEMASYLEALDRHSREVTPIGIPVLMPGVRLTLADPEPHPITGQIGGAHYASLVIQPTEFCMRNGLDFCIGSILKYVSRHRAKNGVQDLRKARHFVEIREKHRDAIQLPRHIAITMTTYVQVNLIQVDDAEVLFRLEAYYNGLGGPAARVGAERLVVAIDNLIAEEERRLTCS